MLSVVIPVYNEDESLEAFFAELKRSIPTLGEKIVTLDADLQDQPGEIHKLIELSDKGFDVVCGWRKERKDRAKFLFSSKFWNTVIGYMFHLRLHDYNCGLKLYTKEAAKDLRLYGGMHRFIPVLSYQQGFSVTEVPVVHSPRKFGKSKYSISKYWKDIPDMFTILFLLRYSKRPLHFFGTIGGIVFLSGALILIYLSIIHFLGEAIGTRPLLFFGGMMMIGGLQILFTGFLAELIIELSQ